MTCLQRVIFRGTKKPMKIRGDAKYVLGFNKNVGDIKTALYFGYDQLIRFVQDYNIKVI